MYLALVEQKYERMRVRRWGVQKVALTPDGRHWVGMESRPPRKLGEPQCAHGRASYGRAQPLYGTHLHNLIFRDSQHRQADLRTHNPPIFASYTSVHHHTCFLTNSPHQTSQESVGIRMNIVKTSPSSHDDARKPVL